MAVDIEKLASVYSDVYDGENFEFSIKGLTKFAEAYAAKVLEDKEREIEEFENLVRQSQAYYARSKRDITELQAHINDLREASQALIDRWNTPKWKDAEHTGVFIAKLEQALLKTPAQSLQTVINETIEQCAKVCDEDAKDSHAIAEPFAARCAELLAESIRELKR